MSRRRAEQQTPPDLARRNRPDQGLRRGELRVKPGRIPPAAHPHEFPAGCGASSMSALAERLSPRQNLR